MANLTITVEADILQKARLRALQQGTSVNALLRDYLRAFAGVEAERERSVRHFVDLARRAKTKAPTRRWTRDEIHER
jgi:plasmid stability protein